jgi:hypothetical protein
MRRSADAAARAFTPVFAGYGVTGDTLAPDKDAARSLAATGMCAS